MISDHKSASMHKKKRDAGFPWVRGQKIAARGGIVAQCRRGYT